MTLTNLQLLCLLAGHNDFPHWLTGHYVSDFDRAQRDAPANFAVLGTEGAYFYIHEKGVGGGYRRIKAGYGNYLKRVDLIQKLLVLDITFALYKENDEPPIYLERFEPLRPGAADLLSQLVSAV